MKMRVSETNGILQTTFCAQIRDVTCGETTPTRSHYGFFGDPSHDYRKTIPERKKHHKMFFSLYLTFGRNRWKNELDFTAVHDFFKKQFISVFFNEKSQI